MNKKEFIINLNKRIDAYINKSAAFNEKKTIVICDVHECSEIHNFFKNHNLRIDVLDIYVNDSNVFHQFELWGKEANYFISKRVMTDNLYVSIDNSSIPLDCIYIGPTSTGYFDLYDKRENIIENAEKIVEVMNLLEDDKSKNILMNVFVRLSVPYQFHFYYETEDFEQYFCDQFEYEEDEIFLDAGVCNGINMFEFANKVSWKYKKIIGFEADESNFQISSKNVSDLENVQMMKKALYDYDGKISFLSTEKSSKYTNARVGEDGNTIVECKKGDSLKEALTFIKMDIEGSEKNALEGLKETIKKMNPKLAVCIYHFQADFWEVPLKIKSINPNYHFIIRNHQKLDNLTETVVYAWK